MTVCHLHSKSSPTARSKSTLGRRKKYEGGGERRVFSLALEEAFMLMNLSVCTVHCWMVSAEIVIVTLFTWVLFPIYREVKVGGLHKVSMWDFMQVAVLVTRVLEIRFGSRELQQVSGTSEECLPSAVENACLPWC
ncbi:unnamed protein product [Prunus brigantina]